MPYASPAQNCSLCLSVVTRGNLLSVMPDGGFPIGGPSRVGQTTEAWKTPPAAGGRAGGVRRRSNAGEGDAVAILWRVTSWS